MNDLGPMGRYLVPLRRWWYVVLAVTVAGLLATWATLPEPPGEPTAEELADPDTLFRATHLLIRNPASPEPINFDLVLLLARQGDLTSRVLDRLGDRIVTRDVDEVQVNIDPAIGTIAITSTQPTPELAATLVTTYAEELQAIIDERAAEALRDAAERVGDRLPQLAVDITELEDEISELPEFSVDRQLLEAELDLLIDEFAATQAEARTLASRLRELESQFDTLQEPTPVSTDLLDGGLIRVPGSPPQRFAIFGLLALIAGGLLALAIDYLDVKLRTRADAEGAFSLPVIAEFPRRSKKHRDNEPLPVLTDPVGLTAEAFRSLRLSVLLAPTWRLSGLTPTSNGSVGSVAPIEGRPAPSALLITSPLTGDGKSTTVANLAASFAESGQTVLVVDCDFRRPAVGALLGVDAGRGLRDISAPLPKDVSELVVETNVDKVSMIRSGEPGIAPAWFLSAAPTLVTRAREIADVVIFDTGPITLTSEAAALISAVDSVLLVNRTGRLSRSQARGTIEQLTRLGAPMAGIVMIGTDGARRYGYYAPATTDQHEEEAQVS
jgi:capsular exopolysaccharide synthesis family protein